MKLYWSRYSFIESPRSREMTQLNRWSCHLVTVFRSEKRISLVMLWLFVFIKTSHVITNLFGWNLVHMPHKHKIHRKSSEIGHETFVCTTERKWFYLSALCKRNETVFDECPYSLINPNNKCASAALAVLKRRTMQMRLIVGFRGASDLKNYVAELHASSGFAFGKALVPNFVNLFFFICLVVPTFVETPEKRERNDQKWRFFFDTSSPVR